MFCFFDPRGVWAVLPQKGSNSHPPALDSEVLTTGPPGKSCEADFRPSKSLVTRVGGHSRGKMEEPMPWAEAVAVCTVSAQTATCTNRSQRKEQSIPNLVT